MRRLLAAFTALRDRLSALSSTGRAFPLSEATSTLGENPRWNAGSGALWWADLPAGTIHRWAGGSVDRWNVGADIGALVVRASGGVVFGMGGSMYHFDPLTGRATRWCDLPALDATRCLFNDAIELADGTLLVATKSRNGDDALGALYRVAADGTTHTVADGFRIANGPAVDVEADTVYLADSPRRVVVRASLAEVLRAQEGAPARFTRFAAFAGRDGFPDGMAAHDGILWVAHYEGACVSGWSRDGRRLHRIAMPVRRPTAVAVGPGNRLFVTSAMDSRGAGGQTYRIELRGSEKA